ncbi:MAG: hypothetical protein QXU88_01435 [Candidatus Woesearchaeota archaeon]
MGWEGWLAALGGVLAILGQLITQSWLIWVGGIAAVIFGIWAAAK